MNRTAARLSSQRLLETMRDYLLLLLLLIRECEIFHFMVGCWLSKRHALLVAL